MNFIRTDPDYSVAGRKIQINMDQFGHPEIGMLTCEVSYSFPSDDGVYYSLVRGFYAGSSIINCFKADECVFVS